MLPISSPVCYCFRDKKVIIAKPCPISVYLTSLLGDSLGIYNGSAADAPTRVSESLVMSIRLDNSTGIEQTDGQIYHDKHHTACIAC